MTNAQEVKGMGQDAYKHQKIYEEKKAKNKVILSWIFLAVSIFSLISVFIFPMYDYNLIDKKSGFQIVGKFTSVKMISEYFSKGFGDYSALNTLTMISSVLLICCMVYIVAATVLSVLLKGKITGNIKKFTDFVAIEIASTIQLVLVMINMIATKVDVSGSATNGIEFWLLCVISFLMICASISLSTPNHTDN